jgi:hypothetical protein
MAPLTCTPETWPLTLLLSMDLQGDEGIHPSNLLLCSWTQARMKPSLHTFYLQLKNPLGVTHQINDLLKPPPFLLNLQLSDSMVEIKFSSCQINGYDLI